MNIERKFEQIEFDFTKQIDRTYRIGMIEESVRNEVSYLLTVVLPGSLVGSAIGLSLAYILDK
ncbi:MAG: hypothetical protein AABX80_02910 [Nanoarchaeota archaeon]